MTQPGAAAGEGVSVTVEVVFGDVVILQGVGTKSAKAKLASSGRTEERPCRTASGMHGACSSGLSDMLYSKHPDDQPA
jgi:hypothetical protein